MPTITKTLAVAAIAQGTVVDHIPAGHALKILQLLQFAHNDKQVTLAMNLPSGSMGYKDLVKLEDSTLTKEQLDFIALFAPNATINIIEHYDVTQKFKINLPENISGGVACPNTQCISNHEPMSSRFSVCKHRHAIQLRCRYCRKTFSHHDL